MCGDKRFMPRLMTCLCDAPAFIPNSRLTAPTSTIYSSHMKRIGNSPNMPGSLTPLPSSMCSEDVGRFLFHTLLLCLGSSSHNCFPRLSRGRSFIGTSPCILQLERSACLHFTCCSSSSNALSLSVELLVHFNSWMKLSTTTNKNFIF